MDYTLNCNGRLLSLEEPRVMGILNVTPDSFYAASRQQTEQAIATRVKEILSQGGAIIDVGACSTRPGGNMVSEQEEQQRLRQALTVVRREAPEAVVSVDTFRPDVARMAVEEFGADMINDVGSGMADGENPSERTSQRDMWRMVSRLGVPYIYMSRQATMSDILMDCAEIVDQLRSMGQKDIILDPGFGFGKTQPTETADHADVGENYAVMNELDRMQMLHLPILVGVSRKSMIYKLLGTTPETALNGTTVLNTLVLMKGASILRVHDVREAVECVRLVAATLSQHTETENCQIVKL
jgi:dihydropteroate synthase